MKSRSLVGILALVAVGCGQEEVPYEPVKPVKEVQADLPPVPNVPQKPIKSGEAYTVWGASYYLRSRVHNDEVANKRIPITGYITKTNLSEAPECAVHPAGKATPEDCEPPIPAFWLADTKDAPESDAIKVMGFASNYAQLHDAMEAFDKEGKEGEYQDDMWGVLIPNPIPAKGAKVTVEGMYSTTFNKSSVGAEADPIMGLIDFGKIEYHEPPPELATLPGIERKERKN